MGAASKHSAGRPAAVLWDMDGTLVETEPYWIATEYALVAEFGGRWTDEYARSLVSPRTRVFAQDSVPFLHRLAQELTKANRPIDLLYLDSYDWDAQNPVPSMVHIVHGQTPPGGAPRSGAAPQ